MHVWRNRQTAGDRDAEDFDACGAIDSWQGRGQLLLQIAALICENYFIVLRLIDFEVVSLRPLLSMINFCLSAVYVQQV